MIKVFSLGSGQQEPRGECAALLVMEQQSPDLGISSRFICLKSALTFHGVGEDAAGAEGVKRAVEVTVCAAQGRHLQLLSLPYPGPICEWFYCLLLPQTDCLSSSFVVTL